MKKEKWDKLPIEVKQIIFVEAVSFGFEKHSTIDEIDYKFWEDTSPVDIAISLALQLDSKTQQLKNNKVIVEPAVKEITKEKMAEILNERIYGDEITGEEEELAKKNGLVVVFGASDDLIELRGAIDDEFGTEVTLDENGEQIKDCEDNCEHFQKAIEKAKKIKGNYGKNGWVFETDIPYAEFDIFEEGQLYGKGLVFDIESLK